MGIDVVVTGIGLCCALGDGPIAWRRLLAGETAIARRQPFAELPPRPLAPIGDRPADLLDLAARAAEAALADARLPAPWGKTGAVVVGSSRSQQGRLEAIARAARHSGRLDPAAVPSDWIAALPQELSRAIACQAGVSGPVLAPMAACATGLWAIAQGVELLRRGHCQRVLAGAAEAPVTPLTLAGFERMGALAKTGAYPFDRRREGLVLGEGAALFVLEPAEAARARGATIWGRVAGFGLTADGHHLSTPDPRRTGARGAIVQCLQRSGWTAKSVDALHAHGTATILNDRAESDLAAALFPPDLAIAATKGATGHALGASGALSVAFALLGLKHQQLPPCTGLRDRAFPLNLSPVARSLRLDRLLVLGFGFGGQNGAIALAREPEG